MRTLGTISQVLFRPRPRPTAAPQPAGPRQIVPIKTYRAVVPPVKKIDRNSRVSDLVEVVGAGRFKVRVPRGYDFQVKGDPFQLAHEMTMARLAKEMDTGELAWPDGLAPAKPKTREEQRVERVATMRRIAESEADFRKMLFNEGLDLDAPWEEPTDERRKEFTAWRKARELAGLTRASLFGK